MDFIIDSNTTSSNNNIINGISDNIVYNSFLISNINITSNYASNISNVLKTNIDNNLANNSNFTSGTGFNTSNYASNISNILLNLINTNSGSSNYSLNISNILKTNIDANNTTTNTAIGNTSNYASNISNILLNLINTNSGSSNYSLNISNVLINSINTNISNLYSTDIIVYTPVRQYPSKAYNSITNETTTTFLSKTVYTRDLTLDTTGISYGNGVYTMYISTTYDLGSAASQLIFDYNTDVNTSGMHFKSSTYNATTGLYNGTNGIVSGYNGEWVILKLPNPIIFNKLEIISRNGYIPRAPAEWRCYGSMYGTTFTEITEASQLTRLTTGNYDNNTYTKSFNNSISYLYIGFTFNKLVGDGLTLNFIELKIFGQERIQPYYISSNILTTYLSNYYNKTETNTLITNSSNYTINASNALKANIDTYLANNSNFTSGTGFNTSNYASNISNVLLTNINTNYLQKTGGNITGNTNINGIVNINNGAGYAITYGYMQSGSLTIGGTNVNYGGNFYTGGNWNGTNTAGLLMECGNNTEIAIHDNATRLASLMYYEGVDNKITLGRNMGWGAISTIVINGNTGIGTINPSSKLHIEHSSTSLNTSNGGLYVYNPNNTATSSSVIGTRIGGTSANKASISLDVLNNYGWSIYITGNDTVDKCLRFNSSCDTTGLDRLKIRGSDGYTNINGGCRILNDLTVDGTINAPSILINNLNISNSIINNNTYTSNISNVLQTNINTTNNNLSTNYYNQTQTNTAIGNTSNYSFNISNILLNVINTNSGTGSSNYASNISNVLQTNINTTNNNLATNYLQLAGGTMTGPITTNSTTGGSLIILKTSSTVATTSILLQNNLSIYGNIGLGCSAYNNNYASNLFIETTYDILINSGNYSTIPKMIFKSSGNIGIGTTDPGTNILQIGGGGRLRIGSGDSDYTLIGTTNNDDGIFNYSATTTKIFLAGNNCTASGIGCIKYYATTNQGCHIFYAGNAERFKIDNGGNLYNNGSLINFSSYATNTTLTTNYYNKTDIDTNITNNSNYATNISNVLQGNINTTNTNISTNYFPKAGGTMTGTLNISSLNTKLSFGSRTQDYLIDLYNGVYGIGVNDYVMRYNAWDLASHKFYSGTTNTATISSNGILTIAAVNIGSVSINNWLFNSSGFNHETISDFNNITGFGYRFINGIGSAPTNGPATGDTQYYSWYIGLGAEYPAISGSSSYGMQFAIGRHDVNPKLCIRRKQDNSWTSWQGLTAEKAVSLTSGDKTISGICSATTFSGSGASLSNIPFTALTGTSPYLLKTTDTISGTLSFSSAGQNFLIYLYGTSYGFGINADTLRYNAGVNGTHKFYTESTLTASISKTGLITATEGFSGNGSLLTNLAYANITGKPTNFQADWLTTIINKPSTFAADMTNIYSKNETSNLITSTSNALQTNINTKEAILTFSNPLTRNTNTISINLSSYSTTGNDTNYLLKTGGTMTGTLNMTTGCLKITGNVSNPGDNSSASFWNQASVGATISAFQITFQTNGITERMRIDSTGNVNIGTSGQLYKLYVNGTTYLNDNTTINGSLSATTINRNGVEIDSRYLKLSGGSITGDLTLNKINPAIQLGATNGNNWAVAGANGYYSESALAGDMVLRSLQKLHLQTGGAKSAMTISTNNNIGIGTDTEYSTATKLIIKGTSTAASQPIVRIEQLGVWNGSANNYAFQVSGYSDLGGIRINGTDTFNTIFTTGNNDMGISTNTGVIKFLTNSGNERMRIDSNGNVGIGITPNCLLHLHKPGNNQESRIRFTDTTTGTSASDGVSILKTDQHDLFLMVHESARMLFFTSDLVRMNILANGYVNIGSQNPNNIFQVGDGARLRISNGISDYTLIGTKDVDNATNTRIVIGGNTRDNFTNKGTIEYIATSSTGHHLFYSSDNTNYTERMRILSDGKIGIGTATPNRNFEVYGTNPALVIRAADENQTSTLFLGTGHINIGAYKCAIIAAGYTGWSRSKLHFCLNNNGASNEYPTYNATIADAKMTILPSGNVGIGTVTPLSILHIEHSSTTFNAEYGGLYLYNPNTSSTSCSCLGARINGSTANKAGLSLDVNGYYGWSMYINGNDTTDRQLRFNSSWDGSGTEILQIRGSDGYATFSGNMQIGSKTSQKGTGPASLLIGDSTGTSSLILTNVANAVWKIDTLNLCLNFYNDTTTSGTFVNKMQITKAGNLLVSGDISAFANMSDKRLKHNITNLSINCIDLLNNIKPVEFIWNDMDEIINIKRNTYDHGFIAQDIEILLPNIVNQYDKYKSIKYEKLTPYLVKGSQELYKLIQVLQEDNIRQQQQIIDLQNQINMIKSQLS